MIFQMILFLLISDRVLAFDVASPDAIVLTQSLSKLPVDIVKHSILGKAFSEEDLFKYEDDPNYLMLSGFLKRVAFEHELTLSDEIIRSFLSTPAEIGLWKAANGRPLNFVAVFPTAGWRKNILEMVAKIGGLVRDDQMSVVKSEGETRVQLKLGVNRFFAIFGQDAMILSSVELSEKSLDITKKIQAKGLALYGKKLGESSYDCIAGLPYTEKLHTIFATAKYLTFNYQFFQPALTGLRASFEKDGWQYDVSMAGDKATVLKNEPAWEVFPAGPAMCFAVPLAADRVASAFERKEPEKAIFTKDDLKKITDNPITICWYGISNFLTPIFSLKLESTPELKKKIQMAFEAYVGNIEYAEEGKSEKSKILAVDDSKEMTLQREVSAPGGPYDSPDVIPGLMFSRFYKAKLYYKDGYVVFSADDILLDKSIQTLKKNSPSLKDELAGKVKPSFLVFPNKLASLLVTYIDESLKRAPDGAFRTTASRYFDKTVDRLKDVRPFALTIPYEDMTTKNEWHKLMIKDL